MAGEGPPRGDCRGVNAARCIKRMVSGVYRTVSRRVGQRFRIALTQPTHGMRLVLDYTDTDIAELKVGEMPSSATPAQMKRLPVEAPAKQIEVSVAGWLLPQAEVSFVWTLSAERDGEAKRARSRAA